MNLTTALTTSTNTAPAIANVCRELSGKVWCARFPGSDKTSELLPDFKQKCDDFIAAVKAAHGKVEITATYRPPERAYLMHWAHRIYRNNFNPTLVPTMPGVNIRWDHPTIAASRHAAKQMARLFGILHLDEDTPPALNTLHTSREAIDLIISWSGTLHIANQDGSLVSVATLPRNGMNLMLKEVGRAYGLIKFMGGSRDRPHWSTTGH